MAKNGKWDLRFNGILFVSKYLVKKYGEEEAIRKMVARKSIKYLKFN